MFFLPYRYPIWLYPVFYGLFFISFFVVSSFAYADFDHKKFHEVDEIIALVKEQHARPGQPTEDLLFEKLNLLNRKLIAELDVRGLKPRVARQKILSAQSLYYSVGFYFREHLSKAELNWLIAGISEYRKNFETIESLDQTKEHLVRPEVFMVAAGILLITWAVSREYIPTEIADLFIQLSPLRPHESRILITLTGNVAFVAAILYSLHRFAEGTPQARVLQLRRDLFLEAEDETALGWICDLSLRPALFVK